MGLARRWEATPVVVPGARITPDMSPTGCRRRQLALVRQPMRCCLLPGHGCPVSASSGEEGGGANPGVPLLPRGDVVEFASAGRADDRRCCRATGGGGEKYHVVADVGGHELETPKVEHRPRLKRLLKIVHLEPHGKVLFTRSEPPTWRANCRRFRPGGPSTEPTSEFCAACPYPDGLMQDETQEGG
jgi:hypothetical protein